MKNLNRVLVASSLVFALAAADSAAEGTSQGAALAAEKGCVACHGQDGVAVAPIYPNLAGQWKRYLREQLHAYRSGRRQNNVMNGFAAQLSDDEIRVLADHYGSR